MFNNLKKLNNGKIGIKLLSVMLVIMLTATNFILLGSYMGKALTSYAADIDLTKQNDKTNIENVKFDVYLDPNDRSKREISKDINSEDLNLYVSVSVQGGGYLNNAKINLENTNFRLKNNQNSELKLDSMQSDKGITLELPIVAIKDESFNLGLLNMTSKIKLTGEYINNKGEKVNVDSEKGIKISWNTENATSDDASEENNPIYLKQEVITNRIYNIDGQDKRVIQVLVESGLENNNYPIKNTEIKLDAPELASAYPEKVAVASYGTIATNGKSSIEFGTLEEGKQGKWSYNENVVTITVENKADDNNNVVWKKSGEDKFVVTYVYDKNVDTTNFRAVVNSKIELYEKGNAGLTFHSEKTKTNMKEMGNAIASDISTTNTIYKGNMKLGAETLFVANWKVNVGYSEVADAIRLTNKQDKIVLSNEEEVNANTYYKSTYINKEELLRILGEDGRVIISYLNDETPVEYAVIDKDSDVDGNGNVCVDYDTNVSTIYIETTKPVTEGNLNITHEKALNTSEFNAEGINQIAKLNSTVSLSVLKGEAKVIEDEKSSETIIEGTKTEIALGFDKTNLSTTQVNNVNITATLKTNDLKYDLYKNPVIDIELPKEVENVTINNVNILDENGLQIKNREVGTNSNGNKVIRITLKGEQTSYIGRDTQVLINANLQTAKLIPTLERDAVIKCVNGKETTYQNPEAGAATNKAKLKFVAEQGILLANSVSNYNNEEPEIVAFKNEQKAGLLSADSDEVVTTVKGTIINNNGTDLEGLTVIGKINNNSNINAKIKSEVAIRNANVYYTTDEDIKPNSNWVSGYTENAKGYKIVIPALENGKTIEFAYNMEIPERIGQNKNINVQYELYNGETMISSPVVTLQTNQIAMTRSTRAVTNIPENDKIEVEIIDGYLDGMVSYEKGQIYYHVDINNISDQDLTNLRITSYIPEGTTHVSNYLRKEDGTEYTLESAEVINNKMEYTVDRIESGKSVQILLKLRANEFPAGVSEKPTSYRLEIKADQVENYIAEKADTIVKPNISINQTSRNLTDEARNKNVKPGDVLEYTTTITNNDNFENVIAVDTTFPDELIIQSLRYKVNDDGFENEEDLSSEFYDEVLVEPGKSIVIVLKAKVNDIEQDEDVIIDNTVKASVVIRDREGFENNVYTDEQIAKVEYTINGTATAPDPTDEDQPTPTDPSNPDQGSTYKISGIAWLDGNKDGEQEDGEEVLPGIIVKVKDANTNEYLKDENQEDVILVTNAEGLYEFKDLKPGKYIVEFEYDKNTYSLTPVYGKDSVANVVTTDDGTIVKTNTIIITNSDIANIDIGLITNPKFDLQLDKYIKKVTVQNSAGTKVYEYENEQLAKADISARKLAGSTVIIEYKIDITNKGDVPGYAKTVVDYLSPELKFNSEMNRNWYQGSDGNLYTNELANTEIKPGETKQITIVLTKAMTETNTGLVNNTAEIFEDYNEYALEDTNSSSGNKEGKENDISAADTIITVSTGGPMLYIGIILVSTAVLGIGIYFINKKVIIRGRI